MKTILQICIILFALSTKAQTIYTVTKTTDPDPFVYPYDYEDSLCAPEMYGTLQWAIRKANDTQDSVKIVFNINQSEPDIILNFTLPVITNKVFIDGTTQQGYISGHPKIKIVGGGGIKVQANGCKFKGLYIEQNNYIGIQCYYADYTEITECVINKINTANAITYIGEGAVSIYNSNHCKITENYIGTNADSCTCYYPDMLTSSCRNGINIVSYPLSLKTRPSNYNVIKNNTIANCSEKAIWIQQNCKYNSISENKIYQCANAIVLSGNGNENKQPPVITSFENDTLYGTSVPNDIIEVFGSTGDENANEYLGTTQADGSGNWNLFAQTTYQYVVTTATDENSNTSNFSLKFEVKTCLGSICFEAPGHPYCSDGNPVPSWCNEKTICLGDTVKIYFCEMCGGVDDWHVIINTNTNSWGTYNFTQVANYGPYQVWETSFIPNAQGYYDLTLYVYNVTQNTLNPYHLSLTVLSLPTPNITQYPNLCQGSTAVLNAGSGFSSYLWNTVPPETTQAITISQPGTYSVTVTDSHGCSGTDDIVVTQYDSPIVSITGNTTICNNGSTTLTAQPSANSYLWSNNSTTQSITVNQAGPYSVTVTGQGNCTAIASVVVTQNPAISIQTSQTNITCNGGTNGSATVVVSGGTPGYSYSWSNGATTATTSGLSAGTYSVTVTDANLCTATTQVTITQPSQINYTASITNVSCFSGNNGAVSLAASGGVPFYTPPPFHFPYYHYQWNNGTTSNILNNLIAGTYTCTITDANSCTTVAMVYISQPPKIQATFNLTPPSCFGYNNGSVSVNVNGGTPPYTYQWNNGANVNYINHQTAGNYNVTITDANQCTTVFNTTLTQPTELTADIIDYTQQLCGNSNDGMVIATTNHGGTPPYLYDIGNGNQTSNQFNNLPAGNYQVTVTDANECTATTFPITINSSIFTISASITDNNACLTPCNGSINLTVSPSGTYTYQWDNGEHIITTEDLSNLCANSYTVTVTNANGCTQTATYQVSNLAGTTCGNPGPLTIINTNTSFYDGQVHNIPGNIRIEGNHTVVGISLGTIFRFKPNCYIEVMPGCTLNVSNALLTSCDVTCPKMWSGIRAISNSADKPIVIHIADDAYIENAIYGVSAKGYVQVYSDNGHFINNWMDIYLNNTTLEHHIQNNEFTTNSLYLSMYQYPHPKYHIYANNAQNYSLYLYNNRFKNEIAFSPSSNPNTRGYGIYSLITKLEVYASTFEQLQYGIFANKYVFAKDNTFTNNNRGVYIENGDVALYGNTFTVSYNGNQNTPATYPYGASIQNCNDYDVHENTFSNGFAGLFLVNNPSTGQKVYKNTFDNLEDAFVANGTNGAKLTCNDFGLSTPNINHNIYLSDGSIFHIQDHLYHALIPPLFESINSHNRFSTDKDNLSDSRKFSKTNASPGGYTYYWGKYVISPPFNDLTRINPPTPFPTWTIATSTPNFYYLAERCTTQVNGNKSVGLEVTKIDSLKDALAYRQNYYSALVDNGNTNYLLNLIQNLQPNNFNFAYNKLMNASPYLSDTVLIRFMIHPINKPPFKKDVVLANSPLPIRVRPYINLMNVNQNFKNQMWAAQTNNNNARVNLENELANMDFGINSKFGDLVLSVLSDTIPEKTDSLLNYALLKGTLNERIITSPLFIGKERYADAQTNLSEVNYLNTDGNQQIVDFIQLQQLQIQLNQLPDSIRNSLILANESWITPIAFDTTHFCMSDALNLLEEAHDTLYPRYVYVADEMQLKISEFSNKENAEIEECNLIVTPNPAHTFVSIQLTNIDSLDDNQIIFCDITGNIISVYENVALTNFINIDLKSKKPGVYYLILKNKSAVICSRKLVIE